MELFRFNQIDVLLISATLFLFIAQVLYYFTVYAQIHRQHTHIKEEGLPYCNEYPSISVVLYAADESNNLRTNLSAVLEQDYPNFEVIVVNDGNTDESDNFLKLMEEKYNNLYHSFVPEKSKYVSRKKLALTIGIKAAKNEWIVLTEARCQPASNQWLKYLARNFTPQTQIVLGYSNYEPGKNWLQKYMTFDYFFDSLRFLGFGLLGLPYKGLGLNLAYRKSLFFAQKGFSSHLNMQRGDDDIFINRICNKQNTRIEISPESVMRIRPVWYSKSWLNEKISYQQTNRYLIGFQRYLNGFETLSSLLFHISILTLMIASSLGMHWGLFSMAVICTMIRWSIQQFIFNKTAADLGDKQRYHFILPIYDWARPFITFGIKIISKRSESTIRIS